MCKHAALCESCESKFTQKDLTLNCDYCFWFDVLRATVIVLFAAWLACVLVAACICGLHQLSVLMGFMKTLQQLPARITELENLIKQDGK